MRATMKMPALKSLQLFDSCVTLGTLIHSRTPEVLTTENILKTMDRYGIAEALVHDSHARMVYPREHGNQRLLKAIRGLPRLHPEWVIEPPRRPGRDDARAVVEPMLAAGVRAARWPMKIAPPMLWLWEDLCAELEEHRVPCFLDFGAIGTLSGMSDSEVDGVRDIALAHPELPLVLSNVMGGLGIHFGVLRLLRRTPNLFLDITGILEYWREAAVEPGPDRVLFATGAPFADPGIYVSNVQYEYTLPEKAKRAICGGNLRRLLEGVR